MAVGAGSVVLVLDAVQDPGNVGTMLRTALPGRRGGGRAQGPADLTNSKVLRGSMGAAFRLPAVAADDGGVPRMGRRAGVSRWVAAADGEPLRRATMPGRRWRSSWATRARA